MSVDIVQEINHVHEYLKQQKNIRQDATSFRKVIDGQCTLLVSRLRKTKLDVAQANTISLAVADSSIWTDEQKILLADSIDDATKKKHVAAGSARSNQTCTSFQNYLSASLVDIIKSIEYPLSVKVKYLVQHMIALCMDIPSPVTLGHIAQVFAHVAEQPTDKENLRTLFLAIRSELHKERTAKKMPVYVKEYPDMPSGLPAEVFKRAFDQSPPLRLDFIVDPAGMRGNLRNRVTAANSRTGNELMGALAQLLQGRFTRNMSHHHYLCSAPHVQ